VAKDIGNETVADKDHPSIIEINKNIKDIPNLEFKEISIEFVHKQINKTFWSSAYFQFSKIFSIVVLQP
jgi:hypothetical protein